MRLFCPFLLLLLNLSISKPKMGMRTKLRLWVKIFFLLLRDCYPCNTLSRFENEKKAKIRKEAAGTQMKGSNNSRQEEKKPHCIECNLKMAITQSEIKRKHFLSSVRSLVSFNRLATYSQSKHNLYVNKRAAALFCAVQKPNVFPSTRR